MKMIKLVLFLTLVMAGYACQAQIHDPVTWKVSSKKIGDQDYQLIFTANIESPWHLYSQFTPEGGPVPTVFNFVNDDKWSLTGLVKEEGDLNEKYEDVFMVDTRFYEDKVRFVQGISTRGGNSENIVIKGTITYMVCNNNMCLPPIDEAFECRLR